MTFYGILRSTWEHERQKFSLVKLESDFYDKVRAYVKHLETQASNEQNEIMKKLFKKRWKRVLYLRIDLINLRIEKHIRNTLNGKRDINHYPIEEEDFRKQLEQIIENYKEEMFNVSDIEINSDEGETLQIYNFWKNERNHEKIQDLEPNFYEILKKQIQRLNDQAENEKDELNREFLRKKMLRMTYILKDMVSLRIEKHIRDNLSIINDKKEKHTPPNLIPPKEKDFSKKLEKTITNFQNDVLKAKSMEILTDDSDQEGEITYTLVKFLKNEHLISVGIDLNNYGPFAKGDIVYLPKINAKIFVKKLKAEPISVDR